MGTGTWEACAEIGTQGHTGTARIHTARTHLRLRRAMNSHALHVQGSSQKLFADLDTGNVVKLGTK
jgi:hypothetical protein